MNFGEISVIITAYNEEKHIVRCLQSVSDFGEILLVDSFSSDRTVDIAREFPVVIYQRPYPSAAAQKNWALDSARHEWILVLDADEVLSEPLRAEIAALDPRAGFDGYWIARSSAYLGRPIRHAGWQRDKVLRFFRKGRGRYENKQVHEEIVLKGPASKMTGRLLHYPYDDLEQHIRKIDDYSSRGSLDYVEGGGRFPLLNMLLHPPFRFIRMYFLQGGLLDGRQGFILSLVSSYGVFLKYAKAWELKRCRKKN